MPRNQASLTSDESNLGALSLRNPVEPIRRLRAEANLIRFPFFDLSPRARAATRDRIEVIEVQPQLDGSKLETVWRVSRNVDSVFPGELARRLHREVVERAICELPRPVWNPIRLGSYRDICRTLKMQIGGRTAKQIDSALLSIVTTSVFSKNTFFLKNQKGYLNEAFHIYDRVVFVGQPLPDGQVADSIYVVLGSWYLENINASYVVPLDFDYLRSIRGPVASRMYELFHHWFFVSLRGGHPTIERRYSTLCSYFPLTRQDTLWKAKKQLREAHVQHHQNGYLASLPEWRPIRGTRKDWTIVYTAGKRALDERRRNQSRRGQDALSPDELSHPVRPALPPALPDASTALAKELELRGVSLSIALSLVRDRDLVQVQRKLEIFDWLMAKPECPIDRNPAGYLRNSIEQGFAEPEGFIPAAERQRRAAEAAALVQAEKTAAASAQHEQQTREARLDALWDSLSEQDRNDLRQQARATLTPYAQTALQKEELAGTRGVGHLSLEAEVRKLLAARLHAE